MNKKIMSLIIATLMIAGLTSIPAFAVMGSGSVVIGNKAFDLEYANKLENLNEITNAIVAGGKVYVKNFSGNWIDNNTGLTINSSIIPAVTYKSAAGTSNFDAGDKDHVVILLVQSVSTVSTKNVPYGVTVGNVALPTTVTLKLSDNTTRNVNVTWTCPTYNGTKAATYMFTGAYALPSGVTGTKPVVTVNVVVGSSVDTIAAKAVDTKIIALPILSALTLSNKASVVAARSAYTAITSAQKLLVTKLTTLVAAEGQIVILQAKADELKAETSAETAVSAAEKSRMAVDVNTAKGLVQAVKDAIKLTAFNTRISNINILNEVVSKGNNTFKLTPYDISISDLITQEMGDTPAAVIGGQWCYASINAGKYGYYLNIGKSNQTFVASQTGYDNIKGQLTSNIDPLNLENDSSKVYEFLELSYSDCVSAGSLNTMLGSNNILSGKGQVFIDAAKAANVNPIYLAGHAILETGHGTSVLANGGAKKITGEYTYGMPVYNFFGIGAVDKDADAGGTTTAYNKGWISIDLAIYGGAAWISNGYINNGQNTLYKMRYNSLNISHQYATDVNWASSQIKIIQPYFDLCPDAKLTFDIPVYK